jgi:hypothetical protein
MIPAPFKNVGSLPDPDSPIMIRIYYVVWLQANFPELSSNITIMNISTYLELHFIHEPVPRDSQVTHQGGLSIHGSAAGGSQPSPLPLHAA